MFIEKYQPYTQFIITYNGKKITEDNPVTLPTVVKGEYKVNLDAIGYNRDDERENLPFTRNSLTWWLVNSELNLLTKEINIGDEVGTKFTIDDSGTLSIVSPSYSAPENSNISVTCFLGKPHTLNTQEIDFNTEIFGSKVLPFSCGGGGGGITFPTFTISANTTNPSGDFVWSTTSTYAEVKSIYNEHGLNEAMPYILNNHITGLSSWGLCSFLNDLTGLDFPSGVNEGFVLTLDPSSGETLFANDGNFYSANDGGDH